MLFLGLTVLAGLANANTLVNTALGSVQGFEYTTTSGIVSDIFLGIPFATAGRFEKPVPVQPWSGTLNATQFGDSCIPHTRRALLPFPTSENCLTLNIFRPKNRLPFHKLPVLIWIHGGGFEIGSARLFGYTGFANNYIPKNLVVVTIQYRVGVHGFLAQAAAGIKGNYGLWDMAEALNFIKQHIGSFGGDNDRITVWGHSAGGCAANQLVTSPVTRDLIQGSIEMSGSAQTTWGMGPSVEKNSLELIQQLGCQQNTLNCLKSKTVDEIYDAVEVVGYTTNVIDNIKWGPVIDGEFLPKAPELLALEAPPKPAIVGVSDNDAAYFGLLGYSPYIQNLSIAAADQPSFDKQAFMNKITPLIDPSWYGNKTDQVLQLIEEFYAPDGKDNGYYLMAYNQFMNGIVFFAPAIDSIRYRNQAGWTTYAYKFEQYNDVIWTQKQEIPEEAWGSVHTNEYSYMMESFWMGAFQLTGADGQTRDSLVSAISSFTRFGVPIVPGKIWLPTSNFMNYFVFKGEGRFSTGLYARVMNFTARLRALGFDLSTQRPYPFTYN